MKQNDNPRTNGRYLTDEHLPTPSDDPRAPVVPNLGFDEDHRVGPSREGGSVKRSHRAEGRNWID